MRSRSKTSYRLVNRGPEVAGLVHTRIYVYGQHSLEWEISHWFATIDTLMGLVTCLIIPSEFLNVYGRVTLYGAVYFTVAFVT